MVLAPLSGEQTQAPGGHRHAQSQQPGRFMCGVDADPWTLPPHTYKMPRNCPSPLLPTLGEGWLPPGLSPLLEAWVAAGRTGWVLPLPLGAEVGTWRVPRVADAAAAHTWSPCRAVCSLHVLPSPSSPACHGRARGAPAPGPVGCIRKQHLGNQVRRIPCGRPEGRARGLRQAGPRPPAASDPADLAG